MPDAVFIRVPRADFPHVLTAIGETFGSLRASEGGRSGLTSALADRCVATDKEAADRVLLDAATAFLGTVDHLSEDSVAKLLPIDNGIVSFVTPGGVHVRCSAGLDAYAVTVAFYRNSERAARRLLHRLAIHSTRLCRTDVLAMLYKPLPDGIVRLVG